MPMDRGRQAHSRRSFLADGAAIVSLAAAAVAVAVSTASAPPPSADAELIRLGAELDWMSEYWDGWEPTASDEEVERYWADVISPLVERIEACSAATVEGLRVKARAIRFLAGDELQPEEGNLVFERLGLAIVRELLTLEPQP